MFDRLLRRLLKVDCVHCRAKDHEQCDLVWPPGCMCRIRDNHMVL